MFIGTPDFVSDWLTISFNDSMMEIEHGLGEAPLLVDVQVKATSGPNSGYIFPGIGMYNPAHELFTLSLLDYLL